MSAPLFHLSVAACWMIGTCLALVAGRIGCYATASATTLFLMLCWLRGGFSTMETLLHASMTAVIVWQMWRVVDQEEIETQAAEYLADTAEKKLTDDRLAIAKLQERLARLMRRTKTDRVYTDFVRGVSGAESWEDIEPAFRNLVVSVWKPTRALLWFQTSRGNWVRLFQEGVPLAMPEPSRLPRQIEFSREGMGLRMLIPIWHHHDPLAMLVLELPDTDVQQESLTIQGTLWSSFVLFPLLRVRTRMMVEQETFCDPKTGWWSNAALWEMVEQELARSADNKKRFSIISIRLTEAERLRKSYPKALLQAFWSDWMGYLQPYFYDTDLVASDVFGQCYLLLPGTDPEKLKQKCALLVQSLNEQLFYLGLDTIHVTNEIQMANFPEHGLTLPALQSCLQPKAVTAPKTRGFSASR